MKEIFLPDEVLNVLLNIADIDFSLSKEIRIAFTLIAKKPHVGKLLSDNMRLYSDPEGQFRISYNSVPTGNEIEVLGVFI